MQKRHHDKDLYFQELNQTSTEFYIPYIKNFKTISAQTKVLEVGCGEGGNLLPFANLGCQVLGIDLAESKIKYANELYSNKGIQNAEFIAMNFLDVQPPIEEKKFDLIILHDVIEHIPRNEKKTFIKRLSEWMKKDGILFVAFPAWQMPFGGHQQICHNKISSRLPFMHLLPTFLYKLCLNIFHEKQNTIKELIEIKYSRMTIEVFESIIAQNKLIIEERLLWFINPHYKVKFGLKPLRLHSLLCKIPYVRNFFSTSCFYIIKNQTYENQA